MDITRNVKGMANMKYSNDTIQFVTSLVRNFAKYDSLSEQYVLSIDDLAEFDIAKLAGLLLSSNYDFFMESISWDNKKFGSMCASVLTYLGNADHSHAKEIFLDAWREDLIAHCRPHLEQLLELYLEYYNQDHAA